MNSPEPAGLNDCTLYVPACFLSTLPNVTESAVKTMLLSTSVSKSPLKNHVKLLPEGKGLEVKISCTAAFVVPSLAEYLSCPLYSGASKRGKRALGMCLSLKTQPTHSILPQ